MVLAEIAHNGADFLLRLGSGVAGREAADDLEKVIAVGVAIAWLESSFERGKDFGRRPGKGESFRQYAEHGVAVAVQVNLLPDYFPGTAEMALPEAEGEYGDIRRIGGVFGGPKKAAEHRRNTENREEVGRRGDAVDALGREGLALARDIERDVTNGGKGGERASVAPPIGEVAGGDSVVMVLLGGPNDVAFEDFDQSFGVSVGQGLKQEGIDDAEDGGVGAKPEGEHHDGGEGKTGTPAQLPKRKLHIFQETVEGRWVRSVSHSEGK